MVIVPKPTAWMAVWDTLMTVLSSGTQGSGQARGSFAAGGRLPWSGPHRALLGGFAWQPDPRADPRRPVGAACSPAHARGSGGRSNLP